MMTCFHHRPSALQAWLVLLVTGLLACTSSSVDAPPAPRRLIVPRFRSTSTFAGPATFHAAVERVAAQIIVTASAPDRPSPGYAAFLALTRLAPATLMLQHESPVIRAYAAHFVLSAQADEAMQVAPLLLDPTPITVQVDGGPLVQTDISALVQQEACGQAHTPTVRNLLLYAAQQPALGQQRASAILCMTNQAPEQARLAALAVIAGRQAALLPAALRALAVAGRREDFTTVRRLVAHPDARVRAAAASALPPVGGPAEPILRQMLDDRDPRASLAASLAYPRLHDADQALLHGLLRHRDEQVRRQAARRLALRGTAETLNMVQEYLLREPASIEIVEALQHVDNELARALLREQAQSNPEESMRMQALRQLTRLRDQQSRPIFRRSLEAPYVNERLMAVKGIVALSDHHAVPLLLDMLRTDPHRSGRIAAAAALIRLDPPGAGEQILAVVRQERTPLADEIRLMVEHADEVRQSPVLPPPVARHSS